MGSIADEAKQGLVSDSITVKVSRLFFQKAGASKTDIGLAL
ncbi:hypothetical protein BJP36_38965 [Moorena producens JHB]|uniref:Uncharacterized protein n=1 Tax=Moorena producens (strain JHB) TaxID=1454205 RepID=A0A9Q9SUV8_MOOP1|nr:hypothetical protein [Moorena producens]WAN70050.1 hypothetical protein BJP36_38965 [Moorena producens JHB]